MLKCSIYGIVALSLAACATPSQPGSAGNPAADIQVQSGKEFEIGVGQQAHIQGTPIVIRFRNVSNDSRCATDVQCVWAGNAIVRLQLSQGDGPSVESSVNTTLEPKVVKFGGYSIKLVGLKPAPLSTKPIPAGNYVATLEVSPQSSEGSWIFELVQAA